MAWFDDLIDATQELLDDVAEFVYEEGDLPPFGAGVRVGREPEDIAPGGPDDPIGHLIGNAFRKAVGKEPRDMTKLQIRREVNQHEDEIRTILRDTIEVEDLNRSQLIDVLPPENMPVEYSDWISIAFEVAKEKGATFETSQAEIQDGKAPTSEAIQVFAEIWSERKDEISRSETRAREIARSEITV